MWTIDIHLQIPHMTNLCFVFQSFGITLGYVLSLDFVTKTDERISNINIKKKEK